MSFWKQDPPKPTEAFRNLLPMRVSVPMACATCKMEGVGDTITSPPSRCCLPRCASEDGTDPPLAPPTCCTSAPVVSHSAEMALMDEMRCARKALAVSLASSADHRLAVSTRSDGIQFSYTAFSVAMALRPDSVSLPPMRTCKFHGNHR